MNFPFYIARRYLFSKKSTHAINVISLISVLGVSVATMALVVVLSGFNGFSDLVASFFTNFDPQLKIEAAKGKAMPADDALLQKVRHLPTVEVATECVEDQALAVYHDKQAMVTVKGVEDNFDSLTHISNMETATSRSTQPTCNTAFRASGWHRTSVRAWRGRTTCRYTLRSGRGNTMPPTRQMPS